jgi:hypothetical protein
VKDKKQKQLADVRRSVYSALYEIYKAKNPSMSDGEIREMADISADEYMKKLNDLK